MEIVGIAFRKDLAGIRVDPVGDHFSSRIRPAIPNQDVAIFAARRLVHDGAKFTIVESLIALNRCRNLTNRDGRLFLRIRLELENVDAMSNAGTVSVPQENAIAGDPKAASIAFAVEISTFPFSCRRVLHGW